jgi:hypothetical protein
MYACLCGRHEDRVVIGKALEETAEDISSTVGRMESSWQIYHPQDVSLTLPRVMTPLSQIFSIWKEFGEFCLRAPLSQKGYRNRGRECLKEALQVSQVRERLDTSGASIAGFVL